MSNIYEDILDNIDAEKKAWCKGSWDVREDGKIRSDGEVEDDGNGTKVISRCLVSHVDLALKTSYIKPNGKRFVSKDVKKWRRREKVLATLFSLLPKETADRLTRYSDADEMGPREITKLDVEKDIVGYGFARIPSDLEDAMVTFNDSTSTKKSTVRNLLKKAAKRHPED